MLMNYCTLILFSLVVVHGRVHPVPVSPVGPFDNTEDKLSSPVGTTNSMFEGDIKSSNNLIGTAGSLNPWPNAVIPYRFDCSVKNIPSAMAATKAAMKEWEANTCIRFVKKRPEDKAFLELFRAAGCWATYVGYRKDTKTQISIGNGCDYKHVMIHELGHVIGFWHEQSRKDRNDYVKINLRNVLPSLRYNFNIVSGPIKNYGTSYDYGSIMHYPWNAFAINPDQPTIQNTRPLNGKVPYVKLSYVDGIQADTMYQCTSVRTARGVAVQNMGTASSLVGQLVIGDKCVDTHVSCPIWAKHGHCAIAPNPMLTLCAKSCKNCGECVDKHDNCASRMKAGECRTNPLSMLRKCKVSCSVCKPAPCVDDNKNCDAWKNAGLCAGTSTYLRKYCKKACGICKSVPVVVKPCVDKRKECNSFQKYNYCTKYERYMTKNCPRACGKCPTNKVPTPTPRKTDATTPTQTTTQVTSTVGYTGQTGKPKLPTKKFTGIKCIDRSKYCAQWQKYGKCNTDRWVIDNCLLSCRRFDICDAYPIKPIGSCTSPLGVGWDNRLPNNRFYATSTFQPGNSWIARAHAGRLYLEDDHTKREVGAWCARPGSKKQYLQIDLGGVKTITAVATQGRDRYFEHVKSYSLSFSYDRGIWVEYNENGQKKIYDGNCDHFTPVLNILKNSHRARYIRFHPIEFIGAMCMRVEVYGC